MSSIITSALFGIFLLIVLLIVFNESPTDLIEAQLRFGQIRQAIGIFIATAAAFIMLLRVLAGDRPARLLALVIPFLAAVLLIEPNWSVALSFTIITLAVALRGLWTGKQPVATGLPPQDRDTFSE